MAQKNVLIVGGNSGIGGELVSPLSASGSEIFTASRNPGNSPGVNFQEFDATDENSELSVPEELHGLVYCPGSINLKPFHQFSDTEFLEDWQINFLGAVRTIRQALPALKKSGNGSIVLFSTVAVQTGLPYHASIGGAKGAVEGLVRSLAAEFAPKIRVNAIAPSLTDTPLASNLLSSDSKREASEKRHPLQRIGNATEVANAVKFLLSEDAGFITGQVLGIDGGLSSVRSL